MDDLRERGSLELAYLGDAVYELCVRKMLLEKHSIGAGRLNREALSYVTAHAQSLAAKAVSALFDEEEAAVFRRGRNAHPKTVARHNDPGEYSLATALEAVFGYLELTGQKERIGVLFAACREAIENQKEG